MLKKDARPMVKRTMASGYYRVSDGHFYQFCPSCRERVAVEFWIGDNGHQMLTEALVNHLVSEH